jgi:hypothetical protein
MTIVALLAGSWVGGISGEDVAVSEDVFESVLSELVS